MMCEAAPVRFPSKGVISPLPGGHGNVVRGPASDDPARACEAQALLAAARVHQLVNEYMEFVWRSLRRLGLSAADCDDGCQRVWVVLAKKSGAIEPQKTRSYVFSVVVRVASEMRRANGRHLHVELDEHVMAPTLLDAEALLEQKRGRELL